ncbi:hypothetical protein H4R18_000722 [Coemansia javaensis]|uniref:MARVEL domain-containing protein n=1 Tax=Coemansia javaensis TaxID=2761396 RepID=A0A9W8HLV8_9FUNG|nr:hypothetical protein H4R18_000722 [Coemansia javaensis]
MGGWHRLTALRKVGIAAALVASVAAFAADVAVLAYLNGNALRMAAVKGAAGWALFAALVSGATLPLLVTRAGRVQRRVNRTAVELAILGTLALFHFIAGTVLATKAGDASCLIGRLCHRVRAATGFSWIALAALAGTLVVVGLIARVQSRLGLPLFAAYSFDIEGQDITPAVPPGSRDMHAAALSLGGAHRPPPEKDM